MPGEHRLQRLLRRLVTARASAAIIGDCARLGGLPAAVYARSQPARAYPEWFPSCQSRSRLWMSPDVTAVS